MTVKADARTITYGETVPDDLTYAITGFIDGEDESAVFGVATCSCAYKQYEDGIGEYPIAVDVTPLSADNYVFAAADPKGRLMVEPAPARIVAQGDATKAYNAGAGDPDFTATTEGTFNDDVLTNGFTRVAGENVGTYVLTPTGDTVQGNYKVTYVDGLLTITPATITRAYTVPMKYTGAELTPAVTVKAGNLTLPTSGWEYETLWDDRLVNAREEPYYATVRGVGNFAGTTDVDFSITKATCSMYGVSLQDASATYDGQPHSLFVSGTVPDGLTVTYENNGQTAAGTYTVTAVFTPDKNHEEPVPSRLSATLTVKQATITRAEVEPLVYNGEEQVPTVKVWSGALEATFDLGKWSAVPKEVGRYTATVTGNGNFTGKLEAVCELKPATVTIAADRKTMEYGTPKAEEPKLTATVTGVVEADRGKVTIDYELSRESSDEIGVYEISATYAAVQENYAVEFVPANFEITVATPLVDSAPTAAITYGETLGSATIVGAMKNRKGESVAGSFAFVDALLGRKPAVAESGKYPAIFTPKDTGHYGDVEVEVDVEVRPATLTVVPEDKTVVYGDDPPDYTWHYEGFVNGDTAAVVTADACATNNLLCTYEKFSPVAAYDIAVVATNGLAAANYVFVPRAEPATLTVTRCEVTVTAVSTNKLYGAADPEFTVVVSGCVDSVSIAYSVSRVTGEGRGEYDINVTGDTVQGNYSVLFEHGHFTVLPRPIRSATAAPQVYDGMKKTPVLTVTADGYDGVPSFTAGAWNGELVAAGTYTATVTGTGNFSGSVDASFTILHRPMTVTADDKAKEYGDADPVFTAWLGNRVAGDAFVPVVRFTREPGEAVGGPYAITPAGDAVQGNYEITYIAGGLTITPASPEKTAIVDVFRGLGTWQGNAQDGWKVTLTSDIGETLVLNGNLGRLVLDLNGHTVTGTPGADEDIAAGTPAGDGQPAIRVLPADETAAAAPTDLSVINSDPEGRGGLVGGKGGAGNPPGRDGRAIDEPLAEGVVSFADEALAGREDESVFVHVKCGKRTKSASVQLNAVYETASAADLDLKGVKVNGAVDSSFKFPYTLTWGSGLSDEQVIEIPIKADTTAEANETFVLELQNPMNVELDWNLCKVTIKENQKTVTGVYVRAVPNDATRGKTSGSALVAAGKKVTVKATAQKGYVFTGWFEGEELRERAASYAFEATADVDLVARFEPLAADFLELTDDFLPSELKLGEVFSNAVTVASGSLPTITVSGLPTGLKYYAKETVVTDSKTKEKTTVPANTIYGTPTKASATNKTTKVVTPSKVKVTVKNLGGYKIVRTYSVCVTARTTALGTAPVVGDEKPYAAVSVALSDDAAGKVTGAGLYQAGKKVTLKATANKGYVFAEWLEDGVNVSSNASYVIASMPSNDVSLVAKFVLPDEIGDPSDPTGRKNTHGVAVVRNNDFAGTVTGAGYYPAGKKVTLKATALKGYVFSEWTTTDGVRLTQDASLVIASMPDANLRYVAVFVTAAEDLASIVTDANGMPLFVTEKGVACLATNVMCGVDLRWPVVSTALSLPKVAVSGLPGGLKFTTKPVTAKVDGQTVTNVPANTIYGAPTTASSVDRATGLPKPSKVKVTVTTSGKSKAEYQIDLTVDALPDYAVGTFDGPFFAADGATNGVVKLTVAKNGKISGTVQTNCVDAAAKKLTLSAASFADYDLETKVFTLKPTYKDGKATVELPMTLADSGAVVREKRVGVVDGEDLFACQNVLKGAAADDFTAPALEAYTNLTLTVQKDGVLKVAGKVEDNSGKLISASGSSQIYYDADEQGYRAVICLPSKKGFDGVAEIIEVSEAEE